MRDASGCTTKAVSGKSASHLGTRVQVYKVEPTVCVCVSLCVCVCVCVCNGCGCVCCTTEVALLFISCE